MSKQPKRFSLQRTTWAYGLNVPERAWYEIGNYSSIKQARLQLKMAQSQTKHGSGYTHHVRLIALVDIRLSATYHCDGYHIPHHVSGCCRHRAEAHVDYTWPAGQPEPEAPEPEGWRDGRCAPCYQQQIEAEHEFEQLARAEEAEPVISMLRALHGGDNRRSDISGMTIAELATAIPASPASVKRWLAGQAVPNLAAQAAIERLYSPHIIS